MLSGAFFFFMAIAILSYGIQGALQAHFARKYDAIVVALYRNLSLAITMLPLFFFATRPEILAIREHTITLLLASGTGAFALICQLSSIRFLPVGISSAIRQMVQVVIAVALGILFLREYLSFLQLLILLGLVLSAVSLSLLKSDHQHLDSNMVWRGIILTVSAGVAAAFTLYFFSVLSRALNPFVATYFWEVGIGIAALAYVVVLLSLGRYKGTLSLPLFDGFKIVCISLFAIAASTSYAFAVNYGPYALAGGMITMTTLVATIVSWLIYKERLTKYQIGLIVVAVGLMFLLKVFS